MARQTNSDEMMDDSTEPEDGGSSKSARKRAATAAQKLGERLVGLGEADLVKLPLPESLLDAVRAARSIRHHGALARQRQYIGKLMRDVDPKPLLELLEADSRTQGLEAERFRRVEAWRDRLIAEGDSALTALAESRTLTPDEHSRLTAVLQRARHSGSSKAQLSAAARELFRTLRGLFLSALAVLVSLA